MTVTTVTPPSRPAQPVLYLVDTNILLREVDATHPHHLIARQALRTLVTTGARLCLTPQNFIEFWVAATRPIAVNGIGLTPTQAATSMAQFEASFQVLPDTSAIFTEWKRIVTGYAVSGKTAHDARLVAVMRVYGLTHLLTFNTNDFRRYEANEGITIVDPTTVPESSIMPHAPAS